MNKYKVTPQQAYREGGQPRGELYQKAGRACMSCRDTFAYYSVAGLQELNITGFCEPCFDFITVAPDDREKLDEWMTHVVRNNEEG